MFFHNGSFTTFKPTDHKGDHLQFRSSVVRSCFSSPELSSGLRRRKSLDASGTVGPRSHFANFTPGTNFYQSCWLCPPLCPLAPMSLCCSLTKHETAWTVLESVCVCEWNAPNETTTGEVELEAKTGNRKLVSARDTFPTVFWLPHPVSIYLSPISPFTDASDMDTNTHTHRHTWS